MNKKPTKKVKTLKKPKKLARTKPLQRGSDLRLKTNIVAFPPVLEKVGKLHPVHFNWRTEEFPDYHFEKGRACGLIAQEVEKVFPEMVSVDARGYRMVDYGELPYLMLAAIGELKAKVDTLSAQLAERSRKQLQQEMVAV